MQLSPRQNRLAGGFLIFLIVLGGALAFLCREAFLPHRVHWANDVPLGAMMDSSARLPGTFAGHWTPLYWIGGATPSSSPAFSILLQTIFPPEIYLKIFLPACMFFLGFGAWLFFKEAGFSPGVCIVGGLGAGLNMHYFSNATWGLGNWCVSAAMVLVALAVIVSPRIRTLWIKAALAGMSIGMVVMEGFDAGAILSLYVGVFIVFYFLTEASTPLKGISRTVGMGALVVLFALLISSSTLYTLIGTQIKGVSNTGQTEGEKKAHWDFTTQWSFPKLETLRLVVPGLFGYRLNDYITDTNRASAYWGSIAEDPRINELESGREATRVRAAQALGLPQDVQNVMAGYDTSARRSIVNQVKGMGVQLRHTGSGDYTGVLVCLLAVFGLFNSWRKMDSPFSKNERQTVWFWAVAALISLVAAWGRYSWLYQFIYRLPFINNIRSPIKFLHALNVCLIILSGYGLEALYRRYMRNPITRADIVPLHVLHWWKKAAAFDKKWVTGTFFVLIAAILGLIIFASNKNDIVQYLEHSGFSADMAPRIADFSMKEIVLFLVFFAASTGVIMAILSGAWTGARTTWAWVLLGGIMILDLSRADAPWVRYYDVQQKYSMNPVVDFLRHEPWEHRVMSRFLPMGGYIPGEGYLGGLCHWWLENDYLAHDIQSLEIDQAPRMPDLDKNYIGAFQPHSQQDIASPVRLWRLTNTRYIFADANITPALNQLADPKNSFSNVMLMDIVKKPNVEQPEDAGDLTVQPNDNGHVALIEFTAALPRAKLYSNWQVMGDSETLAKLNSPEFDPTKMVLISTNSPLAAAPANAPADPGTVKITRYQSRDVQLQADVKTPAVMMLNDRTGEFWNVWIDDKPATLLRCNYIMRGVYLTPGQHTIEFRFQPPLQWLYVSLAAFGVGILLVGYVVITRPKTTP